MQSVTSNAVAQYLNGTVEEGSKIVIRELSTSVSNASTLKYTGLSLTLEKEYFWIVTASASWNNVQPIEVVVSTSSTNGTGSYVYDSGTFKGRLANCVTFRSATADLSLYLWARWNNNSQNTVNFKTIGFRKP